MVRLSFGFTFKPRSEFSFRLVLGLGLVFRLRVRVWLLDPRVTDSTSIFPNLIMFSFSFAIYLKSLSAVHFPAVSPSVYVAYVRGYMVAYA